MDASPTTCPACGAVAETGPFCRMCGAPLYREQRGPRLARAVAGRIRERASYAFATLRTRSTARSEVLALRAQRDRICAEIRDATYELGDAVLRDDGLAVAALRARIAALEAEAAGCGERIDQVARWASGAVARERLAVQPTRIERA